MRIIELSDNVGVSAQIHVRDVPAIAQAGYKVLINNRPDGEDPGQPNGAEIEAAATAAGLEYHFLPVSAENFPGPRFEDNCALLADPAEPVMAFCRSGTRCANLWVCSQPEADRQDAAQKATQHGFDLGFAAQFLSR